jgi:WD40 repeat protein
MSTRPARRSPALALAFALGSLLVGAPAAGQEGDFDAPQVVLDPGGHQATPRALAFTPDGTQLLSAGLDKVVRVWEVADGRPRLVRTLRPPIWRGPAGGINAMALSPHPIPGEPAQHYLAVGGYGVTQPRGAVLLYRFPGRPEFPTGDVLALLPAWNPGADEPDRHRDPIAALAFSPDGRHLASADAGGRVVIWDLATRRALRTIAASDRPVLALGYDAGGARLVTGDAGGWLRAWDPATGAALAAADPALARAPGADPAADSILNLGVLPDGRGVVVGRENGALEWYEGDWAMPPSDLPTTPEQGPIEALAVAPDGRSLLVSVIARRLANPAAPPAPACDVELRRLPDGAVVGRPGRTDHLAYAVAFRPDGRQVAWAGGTAQPLVVSDWPAARPAVAMQGAGRASGYVAWSESSRTVVAGASGAEDDPSRFAFDLAARAPADLPAAPRGGLRAWGGYRVEAVAPERLSLTLPDGRTIALALDPRDDRRWWDFVLVPPGPGHDAPTVAVACEAGVVLFDARDGRRTRVYAGHAGPPLALAPSPDGRWLASGGLDQTVRAWPLAGCDRRPTLGAAFERTPEGDWRVSRVEPLGFADRDRMRLRPGDLVQRAIIGRREWAPAEFPAFLAAADAAEPGATIQLVIRRGDEVLPMLTTKRDAPALSLFVGADREWVLWHPRGFYETSVAGDRKYLLWHRNAARPDAPTEIFPADRFERELRRPDVLATLWATGDLGQALALVAPALRDPEPFVRAGAPPRVAVAGPPGRLPDRVFVTAAPVVAVTPRVEATDGRSPIAAVRVQVEGQTVAIVPVPPGGAAALAPAPVAVPVPEGRHRVSVIATNAQGRETVTGFDVEVTAPPPRPARLAILAIGVEGPFARPDLPPIRFAGRDATEVSRRYAALGGTVYEDVIAYPVLAAADATSATIAEAFAQVGRDGLGPRDTLLVLLESHFVSDGHAGAFVGTDAGPGAPPERAIAAAVLAGRLADVATRGCRVLLLVDAVHEAGPPAWEAGFREWVRGVTKGGVVTFVASNRGPSRRYLPDPHGVFALGVLQAPTARGQSRPWLDPASAFTLDDFGDAVSRRVEELSSRRQRAVCYFPETISPQTPLFDAKAGGRR